ncbi:hypothetical protein L7F22_068329 [Adiantum nelumboides]|nr:hypothetical protein [Adiantum nelumboides]
MTRVALAHIFGTVVGELRRNKFEEHSVLPLGDNHLIYESFVVVFKNKFCFLFMVSKSDFVSGFCVILFSSNSLKLVTSSMLVLVTDFCKLVSTRGSSENCLILRFAGNWLVLRFCVNSVNWLLVSSLVCNQRQLRTDSGLRQACCLLIFGIVQSFGFRFGPSAGTQGCATQDPHIAASDSSSDFDIMEGYPMQQHPESSSQDIHALGQQPGASMFSRLKETLSRATRSEHATNEINEGDGEVDLPFTSQIDLILSESAHVSTPATTPIGPSKLTPFETLLPDGRSLAEVQEVERYILAAGEKEIESLRKAKQRRAILAKAPMTLALPANALQSPELTALKSQTIGSHIASASKDTSNTSVLDGVFLNENWEYNLQTKKLTDLYTSYTYHVGWLDMIQVTSNSTSVDKQQRMICDVIHSIVQMERQNLGINMPLMGPMRFLDTAQVKQPTISQMETPSMSPMDPSYIVLPGVSMQSELTHGSFGFLDLVQPSLGDLLTPTMHMTGGAPSTSMASTTQLHTSVAPMPKPVNVHQPYVPVATHPYVAPMPPPNPVAYVPQSHYPSPYFSGAVPASINTSILQVTAARTEEKRRRGGRRECELHIRHSNSLRGWMREAKK